MANGLYSNCRKKPYDGGGPSHPPTIGGIGALRDYGSVVNPTNAPYVTIRSSTIAEIVAGSAYCTSSLAGDTVDTNDIEASGAVIAGTDYWAELASTHGICGVMFTNDQLFGPGTSLATGAASTIDGIIVSRDGTSSTIQLYVTGGFSATGAVVRTYIDGTLTDTQTIPNNSSVATTFSVGILALRHIYKLTITVTNNEASTRTLTLTASSLGQISVCGRLAADRSSVVPCAVFYAGHRVHDWDASDYAGAKYQTGSVDVAGTGSAYITHSKPLSSLSTSFMTSVSTGTHTYEVDELSYAWVT